MDVSNDQAAICFLLLLHCVILWLQAEVLHLPEDSIIR